MLICIRRFFFFKSCHKTATLKKLHVTKTYLYSLTIGKVHVLEYVFDHEHFHSEK